MTTIKSYSDIEQSRKLAEILPLESADMIYHSIENEYGSGAFVATSKIITNGFENDNFYIDDIPCWSLAALLELMPTAIRNYQLTIETEADVYNISYDDILSGEILILYADCCLFEAIFKMVVWLTKQGYIKVNDY